MPPPNSGIAPGQQLYDPNHGNGAHMPPPLNIPQNNGQHPNAMSAAGNGMMSPNSAGMVRRAAPEPNKRALYVGGLDQRVTEEVLKQIFETTGHVQSVKVIPDKNVSGHGLPCFGLLRLRWLAQPAAACRMRRGWYKDTFRPHRTISSRQGQLFRYSIAQSLTTIFLVPVQGVELRLC